MPSYNPPLRDMQFLLHEVFGVEQEYKAMPKHAEVDADTRVYLSWGSAECGTKEALANATDLNLTLSRTLMRKGARTYPYLHVGGAHCEADWEKEVPRFMDYLWRE